jgi:hypothetical protein
MDIVSHGLWAGAAYKAANRKRARDFFNVKLAAFWGVFPDLFAFTIPFLVLLFRLATGAMSWGEWPSPNHVEPGTRDVHAVFPATRILYSASHSAVIFLSVFAMSWFFWKKPPREMGGWLLHILLDVPTHTYLFYPTPFLWPISDFKISGFSWATPWFLAANYGALFLTYVFLTRQPKK